MSQATPQQQVVAKCKEVFTKAQQLFGLDLSQVAIHFDLKGRAAGMACRRGNFYKIRFNHDMLHREAFDHLLNDTVPHEIAHIVCFKNPQLGRNHDAGWARVCRALGGDGQRCHREEVVYGKGGTYEYTTTNGHKVRMGDKHHRAVQAGQTLRYRGNKGNVLPHSPYTIVGVSGRSIAPRAVTPTQQVAPRPVVRAAPTPAREVSMGVNQLRTADMPKAAKARIIMKAGFEAGASEERIIAMIMDITGHPRQLAIATYKANLERVKAM